MCVRTYRHRGAVFANTSIQNDMKVVLAGIEGAPDDAHDGEGVHLHSNDGQLWKHVRVKLKETTQSTLLIERRKVRI